MPPMFYTPFLYSPRPLKEYLKAITLQHTQVVHLAGTKALEHCKEYFYLPRR